MKNIIRKIYLILISAILTLPFWAMPPMLHPPAFAKSVLFRVVFSAVIFLFVWQMFFTKDFLKTIWKKLFFGKKAFVVWLLVGSLFLGLLSTIFSADTFFSLWGSPIRGGGFLTMALLILFSLILLAVAEEKDWDVFWFVSIVTGLFVSFVGVFQNFGLFSNIFISSATKLPSTLGSPSILSMYLLLLIFPTVALALKEKIIWKKVFYFISSAVFLFVILLTLSQAAYLGFGVGLIYFLLFYPQKTKTIKIIKIGLLILIIAGAGAGIYLKTQPNHFKDTSIISNLISWKIDDSRLSAWKLSLKALKDRPILGYGPENFSIPFDKYYDPSLPALGRQPGGVVTGWWDRAHNVFFDIGVTYGIPYLIIYLLIFGGIFFQLWKVRKTGNLTAHGIQAMLAAYFINLLFSFDMFETLLVAFFAIGYSLYLVRKQSVNFEEKTPDYYIKRKPIFYAIPAVLLVFLVWFHWAYSVNPLLINNRVNWAEWHSTNKRCQKAVDIMEEVLPQSTILDVYVRMKYVDFIKTCMLDPQYGNPKNIALFSQKEIVLLNRAAELRPTYTRTWLFLGTFINTWLENDPKITKENKDTLLGNAFYDFGKGLELSPKRQEIILGITRTDILAGKYKEAAAMADKCIALNPGLGNCYWVKGLASAYLGDYAESEKNMEIASDKGYIGMDESSLLMILNLYIKANKIAPQSDKIFYGKVVKIYENLVRVNKTNFQYHASLAFVYNQLNQPDKAAIQALYVFYVSGDLKPNVDALLKQMNYTFENPSDSNYHFSLAEKYFAEKNYDAAKGEALIALYISPDIRPKVDAFIKNIEQK